MTFIYSLLYKSVPIYGMIVSVQNKLSDRHISPDVSYKKNVI
jgi:hypothetical protein